MTSKPFYHIVFFSSILLFILACNDMKDMPSNTILPDTKGETGQMYVLSEGLFNMNNSTLTLIDFEKKTITSDYFTTINGRGLGDTGNDMKVYGTKLWIVINVSSQVEVIDSRTGVSIKRIPFFDANLKAMQPRSITFHKGKAYVCSFDGTVARIDTATLTIEATINCGLNPDGLAVANNKLYVSNSGGLNMPIYDNTVSVVNLDTFTEMKKIPVGINPYKIEGDSEGDLYLVSRGNNDDVQAKFIRLSSISDDVEEIHSDLPVMNFTIRNDTAFMYSYNYSDNSYWVKTFDCKTEKIITEQFIADQTILSRPYSIYAHPTNGNIYLSDARTYTVKGDLYCFNSQGIYQYKIESLGLNPTALVWLK